MVHGNRHNAVSSCHNQNPIPPFSRGQSDAPLGSLGVAMNANTAPAVNNEATTPLKDGS